MDFFSRLNLMYGRITNTNKVFFDTDKIDENSDLPIDIKELHYY